MNIIPRLLPGFIFLVLLLVSPLPAFAQEKIDQFDVAITAQKNGEMLIEEKIVYDFANQDRHGIFRYIPLISEVGDLYRVIDIEFLKVERDGTSEPYETDFGRDQVEIKIGDPDRTITGQNMYTILYRVKNGIGSNYEDHDEIYWNVTGNGWEVPIASASVTLRTDFGVQPQEVICFTGVSGATGNACTVTNTEQGSTVTTQNTLLGGEGLTFVASFPVTTFPKSTLEKARPMDPDAKLFLMILIPLLVILNFILAPILVYWYLKNHTKKRYGKPVVNFDLPKDHNGERISPAESGTIDATKLDKNDIVATIFDLAIRKYLRIEGVKGKKKILGLKAKEDHMLIKLKEGKDLTSFETILFGKLFAKGDKVLLSDFKLTYTTYQKLEKENFNSLIKRGLYTKNPATQMGMLLVFGIISTVTLNLVLGPVLIFLSRMLNGRTQKGELADWHIDGLKIFLKGTKRYNTWQAENILTIEKMIPYAISLSMIDEFMKQLKILKPDFEPTWYTGSGNFYTSYALFSTGISSNVTTSAPSSSSGFSGGSSGGGGGGGGGGSW